MKSIKNSTKITALLLCLISVLSLCTACSWYDTIDTSYTGTTLYASLGNQPTRFDPMYAYLDESGTQFLSLVYSGLFRYNEKGKAVKDLCDSYGWVKNDKENGEYIAEFVIKKTAWSDTVSLTSKDFVFAWRRILNPANHSEAAGLLYDIKNARSITTGEKVIYELGAYAASDDTIRVEFEKETDLEEFVEKLASPALVPLREDIVDKIADWSTTSAIVVANGPFYLKTFKNGEMARFERNRYYLRDTKEDMIDKYVKPYRVIVYFTDTYEIEDEDGNVTDKKSFENVAQLNNWLWKEGTLKYYTAVGSEYADELGSDKSFSSVSSYTTSGVLFNTSNELFGDARVRRALSLAVDREELVKSVSPLSTAAKGFVPDGIFETGYKQKTVFAENRKTGISSGANTDEAKNLLKEAGVTGGSFSIKVRGWDDTAIATAENLAKVWNELGFSVKLSYANAKNYDNKQKGYDGLINDSFLTAYETGDFDVILVDMCSLTNSAFSSLAPYATSFCGSSIDLSVQQDSYHVTHISGYDSKEYDALIEGAFAAETNAEKSEKLHAAEDMLLNDMPFIPLYVFGDVRYVSDDIKDVGYDFFNSAVFTEMSDKTFEYIPEEKK